MIAPPSKTPRVSPCEPLCAIFLRKPSVYPLSPMKANVGRLCECDLKPLWRGFSLAIWDAPSAYLRQVGRLVEENRSPAEAQRSGFGGRRRSGVTTDFSPFWAEMRDVELVTTQSRIKAWRRKRRRSRHFCPQCRQFRELEAGVFERRNKHRGRQLPRKAPCCRAFQGCLTAKRRN